MEQNLLTTCAIAFGAVLGVLSLLAALIRGLTALLPDGSPEGDPAMIRAVEEAVNQAFPGCRVISVELEKKD